MVTVEVAVAVLVHARRRSMVVFDRQRCIVRIVLGFVIVSVWVSFMYIVSCIGQHHNLHYKSSAPPSELNGTVPSVVSDIHRNAVIKRPDPGLGRPSSSCHCLPTI